MAKRNKKTEEITPVQGEEETPVSEGAKVTDIMPQPVPVSFKLTQVTDGQGGVAIQMEVFTPTGRQVLFLAPKFAISLSEALYKMGISVQESAQDSDSESV